MDLVGGISTVQFQTFDNTIKGDVEGKLQQCNYDYQGFFPILVSTEISVQVVKLNSDD